MDAFDLKGVVDAYEAVHASEDVEKPAPFNVEQMFDKFVATQGGSKISDLIGPTGNMQLNADYLFPDKNCILELKTIDGIYSMDAGPASLRQAFIDAGKVDSMLPALMGEIPIPDPVKRKIATRSRRSFEDRVRKARAQIRQSKSDFGDKNTFGMILFAMNTRPIFGQFYILQTLVQMMDKNFGRDTIVDGIIYINPNVPTRPNANGMEFGGWFPLYTSKEPDDRLVEFVDSTGTRWLEFFAAQTGGHNPVLKFKPDDEVDMRSLLDGFHQETER